MVERPPKEQTPFPHEKVPSPKICMLLNEDVNDKWSPSFVRGHWIQSLSRIGNGSEQTGILSRPVRRAVYRCLRTGSAACFRTANATKNCKRKREGFSGQYTPFAQWCPPGGEYARSRRPLVLDLALSTSMPHQAVQGHDYGNQEDEAQNAKRPRQLRGRQT